MGPIDKSKDVLRMIDVLMANRPDGGTMSDTWSESRGITKTQLHKKLCVGGAIAGGLYAASKTKTTGDAIIGLAVAGGLAWLAFEYMEAKRY